jgi:hypothetical protein
METWPYQSDLDFIVEDPEGTALRSRSDGTTKPTAWESSSL